MCLPITTSPSSMSAPMPPPVPVVITSLGFDLGDQLLPQIDHRHIRPVVGHVEAALEREHRDVTEHERGVEAQRVVVALISALSSLNGARLPVTFGMNCATLCRYSCQLSRSLPKTRASVCASPAVHVTIRTSWRVSGAASLGAAPRVTAVASDGAPPATGSSGRRCDRSRSRGPGAYRDRP